MSASLVGSEMCIRDRRLAVQQGGSSDVRRFRAAERADWPVWVCWDHVLTGLDVRPRAHIEQTSK
eukprot:3567492-Alexandrium_andersonii.AAC.2